MILPTPQKFLFLVLGIWSVFSTLLNAYDLSRARRPQGPLGVALDYSLATAWPSTDLSPTTRRNWVWSSHITFNSPVSTITDNQLRQIATDAYNEIAADRAQYSIHMKNQPSVMTLLAFGNEIILATSQKGSSSFTYEYANTPVLESLRLCQTVWRDDGPGDGSTNDPHRTSGKCGEQIAAQLYYASHANDLAQQQARVITVQLKSDGNVLPEPPCGKPENDVWGCNLFVAAEGLTEVDINTPAAPYTLTTLAGGVAIINQIQLCSVLFRG